jgi:hypothetical protein
LSLFVPAVQGVLGLLVEASVVEAASEEAVEGSAVEQVLEEPHAHRWLVVVASVEQAQIEAGFAVESGFVAGVEREHWAGVFQVLGLVAADVPPLGRSARLESVGEAVVVGQYAGLAMCELRAVHLNHWMTSRVR